MNTRRKFIKGTGVAAGVTLLPAKSVWGACNNSGVSGGSQALNTVCNANQYPADTNCTSGGHDKDQWKHYQGDSNRDNGKKEVPKQCDKDEYVKTPTSKQCYRYKENHSSGNDLNECVDKDGKLTNFAKSDDSQLGSGFIDTAKDLLTIQGAKLVKTLSIKITGITYSLTNVVCATGNGSSLTLNTDTLSIVGISTTKTVLDALNYTLRLNGVNAITSSAELLAYLTSSTFPDFIGDLSGCSIFDIQSKLDKKIDWFDDELIHVYDKISAFCADSNNDLEYVSGLGASVASVNIAEVLKNDQAGTVADICALNLNLHFDYCSLKGDAATIYASDFKGYCEHLINVIIYDNGAFASTVQGDLDVILTGTYKVKADKVFA